MKGLAPRPEDMGVEDPPSNLAIHEFDTLDIDTEALLKTAETEVRRFNPFPIVLLREVRLKLGFI